MRRAGLLMALVLLASAPPPVPEPTVHGRRRVRDVHDGVYKPAGLVRIHCRRKTGLIVSDAYDASTIDWSRLSGSDEIEECT